MDPGCRLTTAAIVRRGETILLARRKPGGAIGGKWEFPGGKVRWNESPRQALVREIVEELSTDGDVGDELSSVEFDNGERHYLLKAFDTVVGTIGATPMHDEIQWVELSKLSEYDLAPSDSSLAQALGFL